jgi:hypothetical protein
MRKTILTAAAATGLATLALTGLTAQDGTTPGAMDVSRVTAGDLHHRSGALAGPVERRSLRLQSLISASSAMSRAR